jgi:dUTP pyrophosphatase
MDNKQIDELREKLFKVVDPNNPYQYEDFIDEYAEISMDSYNQPNPSETFKFDIEFVNESTNPNPEFATSGSSGFDLRANTELTIQPGEFSMVPTGLYFNIPDNMEIQVRPRSGLAAKHGVVVLNSPGTIDADYTGEIKVILINHGKEPFVINIGDRIAQAIVATTMSNFVNLKQVNMINKVTDRNSGGFGSTGVK